MVSAGRGFICGGYFIIPGVGLVDDAMVVGVCLKAIEQDLARYMKWKTERPE